MESKNVYERIPEKTLSKSEFVALSGEQTAIMVGNLYKIRGTLGSLSLELREYYEKEEKTFEGFRKLMTTGDF